MWDWEEPTGKHSQFPDLSSSQFLFRNAFLPQNVDVRPVPVRLDSIEIAIRYLLFFALGSVLLGTPRPASAQPQTNQDVFAMLVQDCLADVPDTVDAFRLAPPHAMPYLATALARRWQSDGYTVYLADSTSARPMPQLRYVIDESAVTYERAERRRVRRTVDLALRYTFTAPDGRLLRTDPCRNAFTDLLDRDALDAVESPAFPETQGERPPPRWPRRYLEPVVLTAATAVAVFLFFSLRSDRADDGV